MGSTGSMLSDEAATVAATEARIEIVGERRRAHGAEFRARVVAECLAPGARMRDLARRHGICTSLIYRWRRSALPLETAVAAVRPTALAFDRRPRAFGYRPDAFDVVDERIPRHAAGLDDLVVAVPHALAEEVAA